MVAWGRDASGGQLARGCSELAASSGEEDDAALVLVLEDTPLRFDRPVPMALELQVGETAARFHALAREVASALLAPYLSEPEAALYLDAIAARLGAEPSALAGHRASLAEALARAEVGPLALADALGEALAQRGAGLLLETRFAADLTPTIEALHALARDDGGPLALAPRPALSLRSTLVAEEAKVVVESLRVELSAGAFGEALLRALESEKDGQLAERLETAAGCSAVVGPWIAAARLGEPALGEAACRQVIEALRARYDAALDALASAPLSLSGSLEARDRSEDGVIDELGPSTLVGRWLADDAVRGEVRAPVQTTLML